MKTTAHTEQSAELHNIDSRDIYLAEFRGNPELVKFPSTSELFHALLENTFYASCIDNGQGKTLEANETVCKMFEYTFEEITQLTKNELFDTKEKKYLDYLDHLQRNGKAKAKITGVRKNGERFSCEITSLIFIDDDGERRTINTIVDISRYYTDFLFE